MTSVIAISASHDPLAGLAALSRNSHLTDINGTKNVHVCQSTMIDKHRRNLTEVTITPLTWSASNWANLLVQLIQRLLSAKHRYTAMQTTVLDS